VLDEREGKKALAAAPYYQGMWIVSHEGKKSTYICSEPKSPAIRLIEQNFSEETRKSR
jgi:hypothetical protein